MNAFQRAEMKNFLRSITLKTFAISMVGIFVPIYLASIGHSFKFIFGYYVLWFITKVLLTPAIGWAAANYGATNVLIASYLIDAIYFALLASAEFLGLPIILTAPLGGLGITTFFIAYHIIFTHVRSPKDGGDIAIMNIAVLTATALGPFAGGILTATTSFPFALVVAIFLIFLSLIPLAQLESENHKLPFNLKSIDLSILPARLFGLVALNVDLVALRLLWPILMYLIVFETDPFRSIGLFVSISLVVVIIFEYLAGKNVDKGKSRKVMIYSANLSSLSNFLKVFISRAWQVPILDGLSRIGEMGLKTAYLHKYYSAASRQNTIGFVTITEMISDISKLLFIALLYGLFVEGSDPVFISKIGLAIAGGLLAIFTLSNVYKKSEIIDEKSSS